VYVYARLFYVDLTCGYAKVRCKEGTAVFLSHDGFGA